MPNFKVVYKDTETAFIYMLCIVQIHPEARKHITDRIFNGVWSEGLLRRAAWACFVQTHMMVVRCFRVNKSMRLL